MKRFCLICMILLLALSLASCNGSESESTSTLAVTDPNNLSPNPFFSGKYTVSTIDRQTVKENCAVQAVLNLFNRVQWKKGEIDSDFTHCFTLSGENIYYHTDSGLLAASDQYCQLLDSDRLLLNGWIETLFTRQVDSIRFLQYRWDGYGISTKTISTCELAYSIIDALETASETNQTVNAISDDIVDEYAGELPITPGTKWIEVGDKLYRIDPEMKTLCRMERHLGNGVVLSMSEELRDMLADAWYYHPFNYYSGTYHNETNELELNHLYTSPSTVQVSIEKIKVEKSYHELDNKITITLKSNIDQTIPITLDCYASDDNLAQGDWKEITLTAGKSQTIELTFGGFVFDYWIELKADNTFISLKIEP